MKACVARIAAVWLTMTPLAWGQGSQGAEPMHALQDLPRVKALFRLDAGVPQRLAEQLTTIEDTRRQIVHEGVDPDMIVVFAGDAVAFLTKDRRGVPFAQLAVVDAIQRDVAALKDMGVRQEVSARALQRFGIERSAMVEPLEVVDNGWISIIGYQQKGYALVPMP